MRTRFLWLLVVLLSCGVLPACTSTPSTDPTTAPAETQVEATPLPASPETRPTDAPEASEGGELVIGMVDIPANIDPQKALAPPITIPYPAFSDPLMRENFDTGEIEPALAVSWERLDDTTLEVKLRQGVKFQNGEDFNADAVKFTIERALNPDLNLSVIARIRNITSVTAVDEHTVHITTDAPDPLLERRLTVVNMVPPGYVQEVGDEEFGIAPIGTGPFRLANYIPQQEMVFEPWDGSWRGVPKLQRLIIRIIPDAAARVSALLAGDIDIAYALAPDQAERIENEGFEVVAGLKGHSIIATIQHLDCDCPFEDVRVRQAVNYAVDKEAIVNDLFQGLTEVLPGQLFLSFANGHNPDIEAYPYDPDRARALLAEAGYPDGFEIEYQTTDGRSLLDKAVAEAIVAYLADVDIHATLKVIDSAQYVASFHDSTLRTPIQYGGWLYIPLDADFALTWFQCSEPRKFHCDPEFDQVYEASRQELDPDKRRELLQQAVQLLHNNPSEIYLYANPDIFGINPEVRGFSHRADGLIWFDDLEIAP